MRIGLAQLYFKAGDVDYNAQKHVSSIQAVYKQGAEAIFFSELSLTGYEPTLAGELAFSLHDPRLKAFQTLSDDLHMTLGIGLPMQYPDGIHIDMALFQPDEEVFFYSKQCLHSDEEPFFTPGNHQQFVNLGKHRAGLAICYESLNAAHFSHCLKLGATAYLASVAKHNKGITQAWKHYADLAQNHKMPVAVVNAIGPSDNFICGGQTACWDVEGNLQGSLSANEEGLLMVDWEL